MVNIAAHARRPAEGRRADQAQNFRQDVDGPPQRVFQQLLLGTDQVILGERVLNGFDQDVLIRGLVQKAENMAFVHGLDGDIQIGIAGQT